LKAVLTEVKAYSSWRSAPALPLSDTGRAETDLVQIRDIQGLDPVKASVNTSPYGSVDGESWVGSSVLSRNIVLTVGINPDWANWTYESLRRLLYEYFMPKRPVQLVFYSDDMDPVQIRGVVESAAINQFSKDPEFVISVICPDPYFTSLNPEVVTGQSIRSAAFPGGASIVTYNGNIEVGIHVQVTQASGSTPTRIGIQIGDPTISYFDVSAIVNATNYFEISSIPTRKFVQNVDMSTGVITSLLSKVVREGSDWPVLQPGEHEFAVITDAGVQDWELTYFERFGGL
jgi:Phage tail protein RIFT-related domain